MTATGLLAGLCSVTLRARSVPEVARLAADAGLGAVEWGGDVHVPPGDERAAATAATCSADVGLAVVSYGSYLSCSSAAAVEAELAPVLDTTLALGAPAVRVWAGRHGSDDADDAERTAVADALAAVTAAAAAVAVDVYLEFHGGTLADTAASAVALLDAVDAANLFCAWQPPYWAPSPAADRAPAEDVADVADVVALGRRLAHLHVYDWDPDGRRHPLVHGAAAWPARLAAAAELTSPFPGRAALLEFVVDDDPAALAADAATLLAWLGAHDR